MSTETLLLAVRQYLYTNVNNLILSGVQLFQTRQKGQYLIGDGKVGIVNVYRYFIEPE